jgi:hypothetical protein
MTVNDLLNMSDSDEDGDDADIEAIMKAQRERTTESYPAKNRISMLDLSSDSDDNEIVRQVMARARNTTKTPLMKKYDPAALEAAAAISSESSEDD